MGRRRRSSSSDSSSTESSTTTTTSSGGMDGGGGGMGGMGGTCYIYTDVTPTPGLTNADVTYNLGIDMNIPLTMDDGGVSGAGALPPLVPVHAVIPAHDGSDGSHAQLQEGSLQPL